MFIVDPKCKKNIYKPAILNLPVIYKKYVNEKRTLVKTLLIGSMPSLLTTQMTTPFDKLPCDGRYIFELFSRETNLKKKHSLRLRECICNVAMVKKNPYHFSLQNIQYVTYGNAKNFDKLQNNTVKFLFKERLNKEQLGNSAPFPMTNMLLSSLDKY